ncbi:hypothetical protein EV174_001050 [Coemansia sp. RSA 2320]|nr:hypothetical protein EV174_001050 [Coemansia sp. RSA 2320]
MQYLQSFFNTGSADYAERLSAPSDLAVDFDTCSFSWGADKYSLAPITLQVKAGAFAVVIGRVGSGKLSFLSAICSEMPLVGGNGCVNGRIGYVEQKPWIMNATFRENVLMGADYDEAWFAQVVDVCVLAMDVRLFPDGDMTMMCRSGVNLFGEQKARLALARALYLKADVYVLDDLLSAVDAEVERHIVERVLLPGGIVGQKTRILVTHAEHLVLFGDIIITFANGIMSAVEQVPIAISSYSRSAADPKADVSEESAGPADNESQKTDKSSKHSEQQAVSTMWPYLRRYIELSGYSVVAIVMATQCAKAYAMHYSESLRIELMTDNDPATMLQSLKHHLVVKALMRIGRRQISTFEMRLRTTLWRRPLLEKMRVQIIEATLSIPLPILELLSSFTIRELFTQGRNILANFLPQIVCLHMLYDTLSAISAIA